MRLSDPALVRAVTAVGERLVDEFRGGAQAGGVRQRGECRGRRAPRGGVRRPLHPRPAGAAGDQPRRQPGRRHRGRQRLRLSRTCSTRGVQAFVTPGRRRAGMTTSGRSENVLLGLAEASAAGCRDRGPVWRVRRGAAPGGRPLPCGALVEHAPDPGGAPALGSFVGRAGRVLAGGEVTPSLVLLDRDGTINEPAATDRYVADPESARLLPGAAAAIRRLNAAGVPVVVVTNQRGVADRRAQLEPARRGELGDHRPAGRGRRPAGRLVRLPARGGGVRLPQAAAGTAGPGARRPARSSPPTAWLSVTPRATCSPAARSASGVSCCTPDPATTTRWPSACSRTLRGRRPSGCSGPDDDTVTGW